MKLNSIFLNLANRSKQLANNVATLITWKTNITDYVIEEGTSGIWKYRKWNSGVSECWAIYGTTVSSYATAWSGASAFTTSVTFPTGLFVATPNVNTDFICDSVLAISCGGLHTITKTGTSLYGISIGASGSQSCVWNIQVKGRWK